MIEDGPCSSALEAVVYCRDCKHGQKMNFKGEEYFCTANISKDLFGIYREPKWFCADGEMKKEVNKHD